MHSFLHVILTGVVQQILMLKPCPLQVINIYPIKIVDHSLPIVVFIVIHYTQQIYKVVIHIQENNYVTILTQLSFYW